MVYYVLLAALLTAFLVSTVSGIRSARNQVQTQLPGKADRAPSWLLEVTERHVDLVEE